MPFFFACSRRAPRTASSKARSAAPGRFFPGHRAAVAATGNNVLEGGTTRYDLSDAAFVRGMAEGTSGHAYATRVANLADTGTGLLSRLNANYFLLDSGSGQTVFNDSS